MNNKITALLQSEHRPSFQKTLSAVMFLAWPAIVEQIMITAVQYIDTAMVGSLGADATAAVGLTSSTMWLFWGLLAAAAAGFSVQVAQHLGAKNGDAAKRVTAQSLKFTVLFGLFIAAVGFALSFPLPYLLGAQGEVAAQAGVYFRIMAFGMPFTLGVNMASSLLRCAGDTKIPMVLNTAMNVLNMIFNFLLIYPTRKIELFGVSFTMWGANWGVAGAAIASVTATVIVCVIFMVLIFYKNSPIRLTRRDSFGFEASCLRAAVRLGVPIALERVTMTSAQILITAVIAKIGTVAVATNHLAVTAESLSYAPAYGVAAAATTLVGQAIGANKKDLAMRFAKITTFIGIGMMTFGGVILFVFATPLICIFSSDPEVITLGTQVLRIVAFAEPLFGASIVAAGALRGAGDSKAPFLLSLATMWGVRITLSFALAGSMGLNGVWLAMTIELVARGLVFLVRMYRGKWLNTNLFI